MLWLHKGLGVRSGFVERMLGVAIVRITFTAFTVMMSPVPSAPATPANCGTKTGRRGAPRRAVRTPMAVTVAVTISIFRFGAENRQRGQRLERIAFIDLWRIRFSDPRERIERQTETHRRIARDQEHVLLTQEPRAAPPTCILAVFDRFNGKHKADDVIQTLLKDFSQAFAIFFVVQSRLEWINIDW